MIMNDNKKILIIHNYMEDILHILAAGFSLIGGLAFARGFFISKKKALKLGVSKWSGEIDEENLKLPAIKDRIEQRKYGFAGAIFISLAFMCQIIEIVLF